VSSPADKAQSAVRHLSMLYGNAERLRTTTWILLHRATVGRATKAEVLDELRDLRDLWGRIYDAAAAMLPSDAPAEAGSPKPAEVKADDEPEVDW